ncbi:MAG: TRAP transporter small permease [Lachnospiraceae bacterium]|nr:TRAP transporter small permease [Lachnospiraceae bacterium]
MEDKKKNWLQILTNLDLYAAGFFLVVLVVITFLGVFYRYIIGKPFTWLEEVQLASLTWIGFLSAGAAFRSGSHIAIEMVVELFPVHVQRGIAWAVRLITLAILFYLTKQCTGYFLLFVQNARLTPVLRIPYAAVYAVPAVSCAVMAVSYAWYELGEIKRQKAGGGKA